MMRRLLPSPPLSALLFLVWLLLNQSVAPGTLLMAAVLAVLVPIITRRLRPRHVQLRKPGLALKLLAVVLRDSIMSNLRIARLVLSRRSDAIPSDFMRVPLELRDPNGLALLAMILCLTPGSAWAELSLDRSTLLVHMFELEDVDLMIDRVKQRYERPLMEIFES